ncbi:winged helix-turn-helix transcriptional regulator [Candidatus Woesearchaeota archaeon]|nr:winged helix-turn-helix transcriptional regulator [Candidatus Woesearchaeota archaeon]
MAIAFGQPKSVSNVVAVIRNSGEGLSQQQIIAATGLSERSVKYALKALRNCGLIREFYTASDMRKKSYRIEG